MSLSARQIGKLNGLTAEEINYLLKQEGFLEGEPGNYSPTEKGEPYSSLRSKDNGYGGYAARHWEWLQWDESILNLLSLTPERKKELRTMVAEQRRIRRQKREKEAEEYWKRVNAPNKPEPTNNYTNSSSNKKKIGAIIAAAILGIIFKKFKK